MTGERRTTAPHPKSVRTEVRDPLPSGVGWETGDASPLGGHGARRRRRDPVPAANAPGKGPSTGMGHVQRHHPDSHPMSPVIGPRSQRRETGTPAAQTMQFRASQQRTSPQRRENTMRKRILLLVAAQTLTLGIPMATRAYADQNQVGR